MDTGNKETYIVSGEETVPSDSNNNDSTQTQDLTNEKISEILSKEKKEMEKRMARRARRRRSR